MGYLKQYISLKAAAYVIFSISIVFTSCGNKEPKSEVSERRNEVADSIKAAETNKPYNKVGKYVYVDQLGVLHIRLHCRGINEGGNLSGCVTNEDCDNIDVSRDVKCGSGVDRILLEEMDKSLLKKSCRFCVDDEVFDYLKEFRVLDGIH